MAQISVRIDDDVKKSAEEALDEVGLSMSTAINVFLKSVARERRIPFELRADPFYGEQNMNRLRKAIYEVEQGKSPHLTYTPIILETFIGAQSRFEILLTSQADLRYIYRPIPDAKLHQIPLSEP